MASLVERETAVDAERPLVASVFENRLAKNMPLMTDPAVIYGLELAGQVAGQHLRERSEAQYPLQHLSACRPAAGTDRQSRHPSLRAAMDPAKTNYLYFVAAGTDAAGPLALCRDSRGARAQRGRVPGAQKKAGDAMKIDASCRSRRGARASPPACGLFALCPLRGICPCRRRRPIGADGHAAGIGEPDQPALGRAE